MSNTLWCLGKNIKTETRIFMPTSDSRENRTYAQIGSLTTRIVTQTFRDARMFLRGRTTLKKMGVGWKVTRRTSPCLTHVETCSSSSG
nr:hypothetical protein [Cressdnaviricota sp.]